MISIVMAYNNRLPQLVATLNSISSSDYQNYEIIIVDDCSADNHRVERYESDRLKVIRIERKDRWYDNPCIPFNIGFKQVEGDIVVIQNPECYHMGDVLSYVNSNVNDFCYLSMAAYALDHNNSSLLRTMKGNFKRHFNCKLPKGPFSKGLGWYNHPVHRPVYFHFCSAITKKNLDILHGFDERYANGIAYDDNEFVERVTRLGLNKRIVVEPFVFHQWHEKYGNGVVNYSAKHMRNRNLFERQTKNETIVYDESWKVM